MRPPEMAHRHGKAIDQVNRALAGPEPLEPMAVHALLDRPQVGRLAHKGRARAKPLEPGSPVAVKVAPNLLVVVDCEVRANDLHCQRLLIAQGRGKAALAQRHARHRRVGFTDFSIHIDNEFIEGHVRLLRVS